MAVVVPIQQTILDGGSEVGFIKFYQSMPQKPETTLRVFDRNEYYTVHGRDALFTANEFFRTMSVVKYLGKGASRLEGVILSKTNFESFVRQLLLVLQYRVEVYRNSTKSGNDWKLTFKASPGNLQQLEDIVYNTENIHTTTIVMAIKLASQGDQKVVGVAYADTTSRELGVCEFSDNDQFSNVESILVQLAPKECLLSASDSIADGSKLRQVVQRCNILITERKKSEFTSKDIEQDLNRLLNLSSGSSSTLPQFDLTVAMVSLSPLIKYLELLSDDSNFGSYNLKTFDLSRYMRLDAAAARALSLEPVPGEDKSMNLIGLLNKCHTPQGKRLLSQWVRQPLMDPHRIEERLNIVEVLFNDTTLRQNLMETHLRLLPDFSRLAKKLQRGKGSLQDCVRIYQAVQHLPNLVELLTSYNGDHKMLLDEMFTTPLKDIQNDFTKYLEMVESTIDLSMVSQHEYVILPSFDETLQQLRSDMDEIEVKVNSIFMKTANTLSLETGKTIKLESNSQLGYFMRVTKKSEKGLRNQSSLIVLETRNDGVRFTTSLLRSLSHDHLSLKDQYNSAQSNLSEEVLSIAAGYCEPLLVLNSVTAQLDVFTSFAHVSASAPIQYVRPVITPQGDGSIVLEGARHPCLEMQDDIAFIPNDVHLIRGEDMFQIITGPNMGGKSTYIRTVGVVVLMAQIGCFVPCTSASVGVVDCVLARVGAGDSQLKGVSTFMSEMLETTTILKTATKDSLIIIDELGRGTSTYDGFGLAWAISEYIATSVGALCLFATHFHELTALADVVATVTNRHVSALTSDDTLTLLYRVKKGVCDQSFGIHVAELAHFPSNVIEAARQKAAELEVFHNHSLHSKEGNSQQDIAEGEELIKEYLREVKALPVDSMSDEELEREMKRLKEKVLAHGNTYIQTILSQ